MGPVDAQSASLEDIAFPSNGGKQRLCSCFVCMLPAHRDQNPVGVEALGKTQPGLSQERWQPWKFSHEGLNACVGVPECLRRKDSKSRLYDLMLFHYF